jgi:hypothetical protein
MGDGWWMVDVEGENDRVSLLECEQLTEFRKLGVMGTFSAFVPAENQG